MKIPGEITRQQIAEALAVLGLDASTVLSLRMDALSRTVDVDLSPIPDHPLVVRSMACIPIASDEPRFAEPMCGHILTAHPGASWWKCALPPMHSGDHTNIDGSKSWAVTTEAGE